MEEVIKKLDELIRLSDTSIPFIYSSRISEPEFIVGRDRESDFLTEWFAQNTQNCLFIVGMGGIGKSTLIHSFLARNINDFDTVIYANYNISIVRTIIDDIQIRINIIEQDEYESSNEYFKRKLEVIRELAIGKNIVLIIDNYTGEPVQDFSAILDINWKIVLITCNKSLAEGYKALEIGAIQNNEPLFSLFENYLGKHLCKNEYSYLDKIIEKVEGHTLILELIAKQVAKSYISLAQASSLVEKYGFSNIASEKVNYMKDSVTYHETINNIIQNLFDIAHLYETKKAILKIISFFGTNGVDIKIFADMLQLNSKDDINELFSEGWISIDDMHISMHPVIIETMHQCDLTESSKKATVLVMNFLYKKFKLEAQREEYPRKLLRKFSGMKKSRERVKESIQKIQILSENYNSSKLLHFLTKILTKILEYCYFLISENTENDITKEIVFERISRGSVEMTTNHKEVISYLQLSECFLEGCIKEKNICELEVYKNLIYQEILNMPRERDDFISNKTKELIKASYFQNKDKINDMLELFDKIVLIYEQKRDYPSAYDIIMEAKIIIKKYQNSLILGRYYYLLARYYDATLDGHYNLETDEDKKLCRDLIHNLNKAIRYMKKSKDGISNRYLGEYYCFKALVLIKGLFGNPHRIKKLLNKAEILIKENEQAQSRRVRDYNMACAWYYTYIERDFEKVEDYIAAADEITIRISQTDIDKIDGMISIIKFYSEWGEYEKAICWIFVSIRRCDYHKNVLVYLRKK